VRTEILAGVRGPAALGQQTQEWVHHLLGYKAPMGWNNQLTNKMLLNICFSTEKQLWAVQNFAEIIGGVQISAGSLTNAVGIYPLIRVGRMTPYFDGFFSHFSTGLAEGRKRNFQFYFFARPKINLIASNALMYGKIEKSAEMLQKPTSYPTEQINHFVAEIDLGLTILVGNFSCSYTQKPTSAYVKGMYSHNVGNISLHYSWK
ncbi:MAG: lipid A-modifier LpxR family protein, partial [Dyadobacter sp.]